MTSSSEIDSSGVVGILVVEQMLPLPCQDGQHPSQVSS